MLFTLKDGFLSSLLVTLPSSEHSVGVANPVGVASSSSSSPALRDGGGVRPRADVLHDVGVLLAADVQRRVVGLTHGEEERRGRARHQLQHVGHERRGTQAEGVHAWGHRTPCQGLFRVKANMQCQN